MSGESVRFFRPADVGSVRRNQTQIQMRRFLAIGRNVLLGGLVVCGALWAWRQTHSAARFAVRHIEIDGATHTPRVEIDAITKQYMGLNLFDLDIARVQRDLGGLVWIRHIDIEKNLPDTLRIRIVERVPSALLATLRGIRYVDEQGVVFADLSPAVGDADLPLITDADGSEKSFCMSMTSSAVTSLS